MEMSRTDKYASHLSEMIRFETVSVDGEKDFEKFTGFHDLLKKLFPDLFKASEYENIEGSLLLRWKGKDSALTPVLFMNHMDTVVAQGDWEHPPFSGEIVDGKIWGRGTLDNKGGLWGMLEAANELAAEGFTPECDIYFESSCQEEVTIKNGGAELVADILEKRGVHFSAILDEGGMIMYDPIGGVDATFAMVGLGEKGCASIKFTAKGNGGHASTPGKNSPLVRLGRFMAVCEMHNVFDIEVSDTVKEMLRRFSPYVKGPLAKVYANPGKFEPLLKTAMPSTSPTAKALLQTTIAFTMAEGSNAYNVIPAEASVIGNMRCSHHQGFEKSYEAIKKLASRFDIETSIVETPEKTVLADYNSKSFKLIEEAVSLSFPGVKTAPYFMTGCSDGRFMEKLGDNCYRFVPFIISQEQMKSIHGINECVDVSTLEGAVDFYKHLMRGAANV